MKRTFLFALFHLVSGLSLVLLFAQPQIGFSRTSLKLFIEYTDIPEAVSVLKTKCPICDVTIKRESADFVLMLTGKKYAVFENRSGSLIVDGEADSLEKSMQDVLAAIRNYDEKAEKVPDIPDMNKSGTAIKAKVHVYRYKRFWGSSFEPPIYCNEVLVANMDNGRYFTMELAPGKYILRSNDQYSGIELQAKAGGVYYIRVDVVAGIMKAPGRLTIIQPEQGVMEIKKMRYTGSNKIKNPSMVKISPD